MTQQGKSIWIKGIEDDLRKSFYKRILWGFIFIISALVFYFSEKISLTIGLSGNPIGAISLFLILIAFIGYLTSKKHPDYLAYYLYQIGSELPDFEIEDNYLKRNQNYIKNCHKQILGVTYFLSGYFIGNISDFLANLDGIIQRLNYIYSKENIDEAMMNTLNEIRVLTSVNEMPMTRRDVISSKIIELAKLIHINNSSLTQQHVDIAKEILNELKDIPEKRFEKPVSEYPKEIWGRLPYKLKYLIFGMSVFIIIFIVLSQILMHLTQGEPYSTAMVASAALTAVVLAQIDRFIAREKVK